MNQHSIGYSRAFNRVQSLIKQGTIGWFKLMTIAANVASSSGDESTSYSRVARIALPGISKAIGSKAEFLLALEFLRAHRLKTTLRTLRYGVIILLMMTFCSVVAEPIVPGLSAPHQFAPEFSGRVLLSELSCTACHAGNYASKGGPILDQVGERVHPDYLKAFIAAPHAVKPGTTMPDMLGHLPEKERASVAEAIADYLTHRSSEAFSLQPIETERIENGKGLFHRVGCVACHSPEDKPLPNSPPLIGVENKYSLDSLTAFLENPLESRPSGRMPNMHLTHWEALDLASYLLRDQKLKRPAPRETNRSKEGEALFKKHGCAQCHQPAKANASFAQPLDTLNHSQTCSGADFSLSDSQTQQISAALGKLNIASPDIQTTLVQFNCIACHQRGEIGGPSAERDEFFSTTNLNLGEQARIPPSLDGVGAKLKPTWLRKVLVSGASVRPYMNTRMPKFGSANVEHLTADFAKVDALEKLDFDRVTDQKLARESGQLLAGDKGLSCVACHTFKGESATTLNGVELTSMTARLQKNWFHHYLRNPQKFHPSTIMPNFWPGGTPVRPAILEGNTGKQIDALWQYLERGKEARTPSGIRREPIDYYASNGEAIMLRRQYHGIGKRGIGVGYPAGINLSFDAGQMRLGSIWKGQFGEMSSVWRGQGSGNVNEQTRDVVRFPVGPAFALLASKDGEWPSLEQGDAAKGFKFRGYSLDEKQRPTFRYTFSGVTVSDTFIDTPNQLTRTLIFDKSFPENTYFRIADRKPLAGLTIEHSQRSDDLIVPVSGETSLTINYRFVAK